MKVTKPTSGLEKATRDPFPKIERHVITFNGDSVTITDTGGANGGYGSQLMTTLPAEHVAILGITADLDLTAAAGIGATAALDWSIGSAAEATDSTLDATQADLLATVDAALTGSAVSTAGQLTAAVYDGPSTDAYLNFGIPDADITTSSSITVTGEVVITFIRLGANA